MHAPLCTTDALLRCCLRGCLHACNHIRAPSCCRYRVLNSGQQPLQVPVAAAARQPRPPRQQQQSATRVMRGWKCCSSWSCTARGALTRLLRRCSCTSPAASCSAHATKQQTRTAHQQQQQAAAAQRLAAATRSSSAPPSCARACRRGRLYASGCCRRARAAARVHSRAWRPWHKASCVLQARLAGWLQLDLQQQHMRWPLLTPQQRQMVAGQLGAPARQQQQVLQQRQQGCRRRSCAASRPRWWAHRQQQRQPGRARAWQLRPSASRRRFCWGGRCCPRCGGLCVGRVVSFCNTAAASEHRCQSGS